MSDLIDSGQILEALSALAEQSEVFSNAIVTITAELKKIDARLGSLEQGNETLATHIETLQGSTATHEQGLAGLKASIDGVATHLRNTPSK